MRIILPVGICISVIVLTLISREADGSPANRRRPRLSELQCDSYLVRFGYQSRHRSRDGNQRRRSLMHFQRMAGLRQTGILDDATNEMMSMPRCGNKDEDNDASRKKRFSAVTSWKKRDITYNFKSVSVPLGTAETHRIIREALDYWQNVTPLTFRQIDDSQTADIEIIFKNGVHTTYKWDQISFDGPGGVLAHAFFPYGDRSQASGDAHFDADENFTDKTSSGINLLQVAVHEFGHSLGLAHSDVNSAIMAPFYRGYVPNLVLDSDDIAGIQSLYGANTEPTDPPTNPPTDPPTDPPTNPPTDPPTNPPTNPPTDPPTNPPTNPPTAGPCSDGRVDAITAIRGSSSISFAFRGNKYMVLNRNGIVTGYPKPIRKIAPRFDGVDAALSLSGNRIFLFRKNKVYLVYKGWNNQITASRGPYALNSVIPGLPNNIDAIFTWRNNRIYIFKGNQYYRLNSQGRIDTGYPKSINIWGLPSKLTSGVDAVTRYNNGRTYFFKNGLYYRYNDQSKRIDYGYPKTVKDDWYGC